MDEGVRAFLPIMLTSVQYTLLRVLVTGAQYLGSPLITLTWRPPPLHRNSSSSPSLPSSLHTPSLLHSPSLSLPPSCVCAPVSVFPPCPLRVLTWFSPPLQVTWDGHSGSMART